MSTTCNYYHQTVAMLLLWEGRMRRWRDASSLSSFIIRETYKKIPVQLVFIWNQGGLGKNKIKIELTHLATERACHLIWC